MALTACPAGFLHICSLFQPLVSFFDAGNDAHVRSKHLLDSRLRFGSLITIFVCKALDVPS